MIEISEKLLNLHTYLDHFNETIQKLQSIQQSHQD